MNVPGSVEAGPKGLAMRVTQIVLAAFAAVGAVATITLLAAHGPPSGTQSVLNPADLAAT